MAAPMMGCPTSSKKGVSAKQSIPDSIAAVVDHNSKPTLVTAPAPVILIFWVSLVVIEFRLLESD